MASPTGWTWVWVNPGSWWWTGRPGMLLSMGSQRVRYGWANNHSPLLSPLLITCGHLCPPACPMSHSRSEFPKSWHTRSPLSPRPPASPPIFPSAVSCDTVHLPSWGGVAFGVSLAEFTLPHGHQAPSVECLQLLMFSCPMLCTALDVPHHSVAQGVSGPSASPYSDHPPHWAMGLKGQIPATHSTEYDLLMSLPVLSLPCPAIFLFLKPRGLYAQGSLDSSVGKESACNVGDPGSIPGLGRSHGEGTGYPVQHSWASLLAQLVKNLPAMQETWVQSLGWEDPLEKGAATHSSILAQRTPRAV